MIVEFSHFCSLFRSFGVLLWEIASYGQHPHGKIEPNDLIAAIEQEKAFLPKYVCVLYCMSFHCQCVHSSVNPNTY